MSVDKQELMERIRALPPNKQQCLLESLLEFALDTDEPQAAGSYRIADFTDQQVPTEYPWALQQLEWRTVRQYKSKLEALKAMILLRPDDENEEASP